MKFKPPNSKARNYRKDPKRKQFGLTLHGAERLAFEKLVKEQGTSFQGMARAMVVHCLSELGKIR